MLKVFYETELRRKERQKRLLESARTLPNCERQEEAGAMLDILTAEICFYREQLQDETKQQLEPLYAGMASSR